MHSEEYVCFLVSAKEDQHDDRHNVDQHHQSDAPDLCIRCQLLLGGRTKNGSSLCIPQIFLYWPSKLLIQANLFYYNSLLSPLNNMIVNKHLKMSEIIVGCQIYYDVNKIKKEVKES